VYSGVLLVNRGDTSESGWINLKVGIQCVLFLEGWAWKGYHAAKYFKTTAEVLDLRLVYDRLLPGWKKSLLRTNWLSLKYVRSISIFI